MPDLDDINQATSDERQKQEFTDFSYSSSGINIGRIPIGFNAASGYDAQERRKREKSHADFLQTATLQDMMRNAEYAAAYNAAMDAANEALRLAEAVLQENREALVSIRAEITDIRSRANKDPHGNEIYLDENGHAVFEDGSRVDEAIAEGIIWNEGHPSLSALNHVKEQERLYAKNTGEWERYQDDVATKKDRMEGEDNPLSQDELETLKEEIENKRPREIRSHAIASESHAPSDVGVKAIIDIPTL